MEDRGIAPIVHFLILYNVLRRLAIRSLHKIVINKVLGLGGAISHRVSYWVMYSAGCIRLRENALLHI